jgi:hypothetical protein
MGSFDGFDGKDTRPPGTKTTAKVMTVDGKPITETEEGFIVGRDGVLHETESTHYQTGHDGRRLRMDQYVAESWNGIPTPQERLYSCLNPFGHHEYRPVCLEIDGLITTLGNVLCDECFEVNKKRQKLWIKIATLGLYNAEEF